MMETEHGPRPSYEEVVGSSMETWYFPTDEVLEEEERLIDLVWNSVVDTYRKEVSEFTSDSNLIYHNLLHGGLLVTQKHWEQVNNTEALTHIGEALLLLDKVTSVVTWEKYSDKSLEYFYISEEINDLLDDETDIKQLKIATWIDLCSSCLYEVIFFLMCQLEAHQDDQENEESYRKLIETYRDIGSHFFESLKSMGEE